MSAQPPSGQALLLVIDPVARAIDGESVRVAKDVLCAGAQVKIALPESIEELNRMLAHRGRRRPVVIGDDRALNRMVQALHQRRELGYGAVSHVPVGPGSSIPLARSLGLPTHPAPAARAVLSGMERSLDLLVDDSGGVVLGRVEITSGALGRGAAGPPPDGSAADAGIRTLTGASAGSAAGSGSDGGSWWDSMGRSARSLVRSLRVPLPGQLSRLRVEADGVVLADLDRPVRLVAVHNACRDGSAAQPSGGPTGGNGNGGRPDDGLVEVVVRQAAPRSPVRVCARAVTVTGRNFSYAADTELSGPVRRRTWTVLPGAWRLTVPAPHTPSGL